ncbi:hypothetical protein JW935_28380 [candidate division KSB1 bacterium]|nr:hypothetical protein [candidate division KSB1 bacterium]
MNDLGPALLNRPSKTCLFFPARKIEGGPPAQTAFENPEQPARSNRALLQ